MTNQGSILGAMLCASLVVGCADAGHEDVDALEFRANEGLGFEDPNYPGNGDIEIRTGDGDGDDVDVPDILIWDIAGGDVARPVGTGFTDRISVEGTELRNIGDDLMVPGAATCTAIEGDHPSGKVFHLVDEQGHVALTLWETYVFIGDADIPVGDADGDDDDDDEFEDQVAFSFEGKRIYAGSPDDDDTMVARASEEIEEASPMRRLLLGALVAGECGSNGLP